MAERDYSLYHSHRHTQVHTKPHTHTQSRTTQHFTHSYHLLVYERKCSLGENTEEHSQTDRETERWRDGQKLLVDKRSKTDRWRGRQKDIHFR